MREATEIGIEMVVGMRGGATTRVETSTTSEEESSTLEARVLRTSTTEKLPKRITTTNHQELSRRKLPKDHRQKKKEK